MHGILQTTCRVSAFGGASGRMFNNAGRRDRLHEHAAVPRCALAGRHAQPPRFPGCSALDVRLLLTGLACRAAVTNPNAVKHVVSRGVVDLEASVPEAPSAPAAWWPVRPFILRCCHVHVGNLSRDVRVVQMRRC